VCVTHYLQFSVDRILGDFVYSSIEHRSLERRFVHQRTANIQLFPRRLQVQLRLAFLSVQTELGRQFSVNS